MVTVDRDAIEQEIVRIRQRLTQLNAEQAGLEATSLRLSINCRRLTRSGDLHPSRVRRLPTVRQLPTRSPCFVVCSPVDRMSFRCVGKTARRVAPDIRRLASTNGQRAFAVSQRSNAENARIRHSFLCQTRSSKGTFAAAMRDPVILSRERTPCFPMRHAGSLPPISTGRRGRRTPEHSWRHAVAGASPPVSVGKRRSCLDILLRADPGADGASDGGRTHHRDNGEAPRNRLLFL